MNKLISKLNPNQQEAALHIDGPLLILAGAGSGKTSTMTHRIAYMVEEKGISPYSILAVTFTNKAAGEMRERVEAILGKHIPMWIMTFHAACLRMLRREAELLGYGKEFVVYDPTDQKAVVKSILKELNIEEKKFPVAMFLGRISDAKNQEIFPETFLNFNGDGFKGEMIHKVYKEYSRILKKNNAMDFDDLLVNAVRLLKENPDSLKSWQDRFKYIMVDEYQDTNKIQYQLIKMLAEGSNNLCVVGDDDQCIYQWRGADISNILNFERDFKGTKIIKLEQNYRSTSNILACAHSVIQNNSQRKEKKLWTDQEEGKKIVYRRAQDEKEEAFYIAQEIDRIKSRENQYSDFAILYRTNAQSRNFEESLSMREIPYRVLGGVRYYDRREIKDIVAYMRLVLNPQDDLAFTRIVNEPKRGMGAKTLQKINGYAKAFNKSMFESLEDDEIKNSLGEKSTREVEKFIATIKKFNQEKDNLRVSDIYDGIIKESGYIKALDDQNSVEAQGRMENIFEFKSVIYDLENQGELTLFEFLEKIALLSDIDNHKASENAVVLMTMHSAKGLEFPYVFIPGMEDGLFPGFRSMEATHLMEEERRLCYVGMTRAKERLWLTSAEYRVLYGKGNYTRESQFMRELDNKLLEGDGVYERKKDIKFGEEKSFDGYSMPSSFKVFDTFATVKKEAREKRQVESFVQGDEVSHGKFGSGTVIEVKGNVLTVIFKEAGTKKLAADIAPIKKL